MLRTGKRKANQIKQIREIRRLGSVRNVGRSFSCVAQNYVTEAYDNSDHEGSPGRKKNSTETRLIEIHFFGSYKMAEQIQHWKVLTWRSRKVS